MRHKRAPTLRGADESRNMARAPPTASPTAPCIRAGRTRPASAVSKSCQREGEKTRAIFKPFRLERGRPSHKLRACTTTKPSFLRFERLLPCSRNLASRERVKNNSGHTEPAVVEHDGRAGGGGKAWIGRWTSTKPLSCRWFSGRGPWMEGGHVDGRRPGPGGRAAGCQS